MSNNTHRYQEEKSEGQVPQVTGMFVAMEAIANDLYRKKCPTRDRPWFPRKLTAKEEASLKIEKYILLVKKDDSYESPPKDLCDAPKSDPESTYVSIEEPRVYRRDSPPCLDPVELCRIIVDGETDYKRFSLALLHSTAGEGNVEEFKMLVDLGLNPRSHGDVCLVEAAHHLHYDLVRYLLSLGLNPRAWNSAAWSTDDDKMLEILREGERSYSPGA